MGAAWLSSGQRCRVLRSAVLGHSTGKQGAWGPSPPAQAIRLDRCGCGETLLSSFKPRAGGDQCPAPPSPPLSTLTSEECKYLVPQRGSSFSSSRVAFFVSWFCIFQKFPIWKGKSSRKRRVTSLQLGCSRTLAYTRVWGRGKSLPPIRSGI